MHWVYAAIPSRHGVRVGQRVPYDGTFILSREKFGVVNHEQPETSRISNERQLEGLEDINFESLKNEVIFILLVPSLAFPSQSQDAFAL